MPAKKPPYSHRQMAEVLFKTSGPFHNKKSFIPTRLKIEAYTLFFEVLPHLITLVVWAVIVAAIYWAVAMI